MHRRDTDPSQEKIKAGIIYCKMNKKINAKIDIIIDTHGKTYLIFVVNISCCKHLSHVVNR